MTKRVAILREFLLPISETFIKEQMLAMTRWQPTLIGRQKISKSLPLDGVRYKTYGAKKTTKFEKQKIKIKRALKLLSHALRNQLLNIDPALIHIHFATNAVDFWPCIKTLNKPVAITLHGYDITTYKSFWRKHLNPRFRYYPERLLKIAHDPKAHFIAVSNAIKQRAIEFGLPSNKITVRYIGIDTNKFSKGKTPIQNRGKQILFVGRLAEKKGVLYLLQAFNKVIKHVPNARLIVAGEGEQMTKAKTYVRQNSLPVRFLGAISHGQVKQLLNECSVFCLPSVTAQNGDREGFGIVLLEAQASGVPVVTSAYGGAKEGLIQGQTGFAFKEKDFSTLSQYLIQLLTDDQLLINMSTQATIFAQETFNIKNCTAKLEDYYDELCLK